MIVIQLFCAFWIGLWVGLIHFGAFVLKKIDTWVTSIAGIKHCVVEGEVVDYRIIDGCYSIEYKANGVYYTTFGNIDNDTESIEIGDKVDVVYRRSDPSICNTYDDFKRRLECKVGIIGAALFMVLVMVFIVFKI